MKQAWNALEAAARNGRLVILCGAGVSRPAPAGLPTVDVLVDDILQRLAEQLPEIGRALFVSSHVFRTAPFEVFMAVLEQGLLFRTLETLEPLTRGKPNAMHQSIAGLMAGGFARAVITTNFDNLVERALGRVRASVPVVYRWEDASKCLAGPTQTRLLKVHGSFVDTSGQDIARDTIRTTIDAVFRSSRPGPLVEAARALDGTTVLVVGYSGRDRLDVMPFLASLRNSTVIWIHHKDVDEATVCAADSDSRRPLLCLSRAGIVVTEVVARTENFLQTLARRLEVPQLAVGDDAVSSVPRSFKLTGFVPPIFPRYAGAVAGYLLLWAGVSSVEAEYAFAKFLTDHGDDERRVSCDVLLALGHAASRRSDAEEASQFLTSAVRGFFGLGDYHGVVRGHYAFASALLRAGKQNQAHEMVERGAQFARREEDQLGLGLLDFMAGRTLEQMSRQAEAHQRYQMAVTAGVESGHIWLEAGALQGLVRTRDAAKMPRDRDSERLLRSLELVHWTSGGSAPSPWMVDMVDSFWAVDELGKALASMEGNSARSIIEANDFLADVALDAPIRGAMARHS